MKYSLRYTTQFKKDFKKIVKRGFAIALFEKVVDTLSNGEALPERLHDHALNGDYAGFRECHITPDWLLVYCVQEDVLVLVLSRTGTHSDLF